MPRQQTAGSYKAPRRSHAYMTFLMHSLPSPKHTMDLFRLDKSLEPKRTLPCQTTELEATWAGLRAGLALLLVSGFWILSAWPSGATAAILASVMTARLATMERPLAAATGGALVIALATIPSFLLVEVLLPHASGFADVCLGRIPPALPFCISDGTSENRWNRVRSRTLFRKC